MSQVYLAPSTNCNAQSLETAFTACEFGLASLAFLISP
jgi:hypothetical protein